MLNAELLLDAHYNNDSVLSQQRMLYNNNNNNNDSGFEAEHCSLRLFIAKEIAKEIFCRYAKRERGLLLISRIRNTSHARFQAFRQAFRASLEPKLKYLRYLINADVPIKFAKLRYITLANTKYQDNSLNCCHY